MQPLPRYVIEHTVRGQCRCGSCADALYGPEEGVQDHTISVEMFDVAFQNGPGGADI